MIPATTNPLDGLRPTLAPFFPGAATPVLVTAAVLAVVWIVVWIFYRRRQAHTRYRGLTREAVRMQLLGKVSAAGIVVVLLLGLLLLP